MEAQSPPDQDLIDGGRAVYGHHRQMKTVGVTVPETPSGQNAGGQMLRAITDGETSDPASRPVPKKLDTRNGVGHHARVDPYREVRAYTAGPTCPVQSGPVRDGSADTTSPVPADRTGKSRRHTPPWRHGNAWRGVSVDRANRQRKIRPRSCPKPPPHRTGAGRSLRSHPG